MVALYHRDVHDGRGVDPLDSPREFDAAVRAISGVVGTGLFLGIAHLVLIGEATGVREMVRPS